MICMFFRNKETSRFVYREEEKVFECMYDIGFCGNMSTMQMTDVVCSTFLKDNEVTFFCVQNHFLLQGVFIKSKKEIKKPVIVVEVQFQNENGEITEQAEKDSKVYSVKEICADKVLTLDENLQVQKAPSADKLIYKVERELEWHIGMMDSQHSKNIQAKESNYIDITLLIIAKSILEDYAFVPMYSENWVNAMLKQEKILSSFISNKLTNDLSETGIAVALADTGRRQMEKDRVLFF